MTFVERLFMHVLIQVQVHYFSSINILVYCVISLTVLLKNVSEIIEEVKHKSIRFSLEKLKLSNIKCYLTSTGWHFRFLHYLINVPVVFNKVSNPLQNKSILAVSYLMIFYLKIHHTKHVVFVLVITLQVWALSRN